MRITLVLAGLATVLAVWWLLRARPPELATPSTPGTEEVAVELRGVSPPEGPRTSEPPPAAAAEADPQTTGLCVHTIREASRQPIPGIGVTVIPLGAEGLLRAIDGVSDEHGEALFTELEHGQVRVLGDRGGESEASVREDELVHVDLVISAGVLVNGLVVDQIGLPVPGAEIWLSEALRWHDRLGHDGVPSSRDGVSMEDLELDWQHSIQLEDGYYYHLVPGVARMRGRTIARADDEGRFSLPEVERQRYIGARSPDHAPSNLVQISATVGGREELVLVLPGPGLSIRGRILSPMGEAVSGALVEVGDELAGVWRKHGGKGYDPPARPLRLRTDASGAFIAAGLPPGATWVRVRAEGFATAWRYFEDVVAGSELEVEIRLTTGCTVTGRVLDGDGEVTPGVLVQAHEFGPGLAPGGARTDERGRFELTGLFPYGKASERGYVLVAADGGRAGRASEVLRLNDGDRADIELHLSRGATIRGQLVDPRGDPLAGWMVEARPTDRPHDWTELPDTASVGRYTLRGHCTTDAEGRFEVVACYPCVYGVKARHPQTRPNFYAISRNDVEPGGEEIVFEVPPESFPSASVRATIVRPEGTPDGEYFVTLVQEWTSMSAPVPPGGELEIGPMPPGRYTLNVRRAADRLAQRQFALRAGESLDLGTIDCRE